MLLAPSEVFPEVILTDELALEPGMCDDVGHPKAHRRIILQHLRQQVLKLFREENARAALRVMPPEPSGVAIDDHPVLWVSPGC